MRLFGTKKVTLPKGIVVKAKSRPEYAAVNKDDAIINPNDSFLQSSIQDLRSRNQTIPAIRKLGEEDGNFSSAIFNMVQIANSGYTLESFDTSTNEFSQDGVQAAKSVIASVDTLYDYTKKFQDKQTIEATIQTLLREVSLTSGCCLELVLDKSRMPDKFQPVNYGSIQWMSNGEGGRYPRQKAAGGGEPIDLNIPSFWVAELHKEADKAYATPMMKAALNMTYYYSEFIEEMRRTVRKSGHGRLVVTLNAEKVIASAPADIRADDGKMATYMAEVQAGVEAALSGLSPEDSIVSYDSAEFNTENVAGSKSDYSPMLKQMAGMTATSMKTHPSVIGMRMEGSQSLSNTESLVYLKVAKSIQGPVEQVMSRALTLSARLLGQDVYVKFKFKDINLRPEDELEAFKTMRQTNVLNLLSLGIYTDQQALSILDIPFREDMKPLSGTGFYDSGKQTDKANTPTPNNDPMGRALQPDNKVPRKGGGRSQ